MKGIEFTQYLMPDGRRQQQWVERPEEVALLAERLRDAGVVFEIEMLSDYATISMTAEHPSEEEPIAHELAPNGPEVLEAVDRLIQTAAERIL